MARGSQAEIGNIRVDRPMWRAATGPDARAPDDPPWAEPEADQRRLPRFASYAPPRVDRPVDIDLTALDPVAGRGTAETWPSSIGLVESAPVRYAAERLDRPATVPRSRLLHHRVARTARRRVRRGLHHASRLLARPRRARALDRATVLCMAGLALLVVATVLAVSARTTLNDRGGFVAAAEEAHRDPVVADHLARQITNALVAAEALPARRAVEVHRTVRDLVATEAFAPVWRTALAQTHEAALGDGTVTSARVADALPELSWRLRQQEMLGAAVVGERSVQVVADDVAVDVSNLARLLDAAVWALVVTTALLAVTAFRRTRNRPRAAALLAGFSAVTALLAAAAVGWLAPTFASVLVGGPTRPVAVAAATGGVATARLVLLCLVGVGFLLALAGRVEENRSSPSLAPSPLRRPRTHPHHRGSRAYVPSPDPHLHLDE